MSAGDLKKFEEKKIEIYVNGQVKVLKKEYFTEAGTRLDIKHQGKSQGWHKDGQDCARAAREVKECMTMNKMILVNRMEVQRMEACAELGPGQFKVQKNSADGSSQVMVNPSMKTEMRTIDQLMPLHDAEDIAEWGWNDDKKAKELPMYRAKFQEQEDDQGLGAGV